MNLQDTVGGWREFGFSAREAVHELIAIHLRYGNAKGKGSRARRREHQLTIQAAKKLLRETRRQPAISHDLYMGGGITVRLWFQERQRRDSGGG